jgi:hypothetical protein
MSHSVRRNVEEYHIENIIFWRSADYDDNDVNSNSIKLLFINCKLKRTQANYKHSMKEAKYRNRAIIPCKIIIINVST